MKRLRCVIYEDFFVSMYDTMCCDRRKIQSDSAIGKWMHRTDARTLCAADRVICDTKAHAEFFMREFGTNSGVCRTSDKTGLAGDDRYEVLYLEADKEIYRVRGLDREQTIRDKHIFVPMGSAEAIVKAVSSANL